MEERLYLRPEKPWLLVGLSGRLHVCAGGPPGRHGCCLSELCRVHSGPLLPWLLLTAPGRAQGHGCPLHPAADAGQLAAGHHTDKRVHCPKAFSLLVIAGGDTVVLGQGRGRTEALLSAFHSKTQQAGQVGMASHWGPRSSDGWSSLSCDGGAQESTSKPMTLRGRGRTSEHWPLKLLLSELTKTMRNWLKMGAPC